MILGFKKNEMNLKQYKSYFKMLNTILTSLLIIDMKYLHRKGKKKIYLFKSQLLSFNMGFCAIRLE
jgi:hypothetical protein